MGVLRRRGSNPSCEICNQLSGNDLEKTENCQLAIWECVEVNGCPILSTIDADLLILVRRWQSLGLATREAIRDLVKDERPLANSKKHLE